MKVVINRCFGGFSLSKEAYKFLGKKWDGYGYLWREPEYDGLTLEQFRSLPEIVNCVETLGAAANGIVAKLKVVEIPDDAQWEITEYDGLEKVEEVHRVWC